MTVNIEYCGSELELFSKALNWKRYYSRFLKPKIRGRVLEVGAGIGSNIHCLITENVTDWVSLEPDASLLAQIPADVEGINITRRHGTLKDLPESELFDVILYIDVLEHIADDREELRLASRHLARGGEITVLAPSHNYLFSDFDLKVGHYRRYTKYMLRDICPEGLTFNRYIYLDSIGCFCSLLNKQVLRQSLPTERQITFWDKCIIPLSTIFDKICFFRLGKSIAVFYSQKEL